MKSETNIRYLFLFLLTFVLFFISCKKDSSSSSFSLRSREARLTGIWNVTESDEEFTKTNISLHGLAHDTTYKIMRIWGGSLSSVSTGEGNPYSINHLITRKSTGNVLTYQIVISKDGTFNSLHYFGTFRNS